MGETGAAGMPMTNMPMPMPMTNGMTMHPVMGMVRYEALVVPDDPYEQVKRTIQLMGRYVMEDAQSPEIQAEAGEVRWGCGFGARDLDLVAGVWERVRGKIQFVRDEASGATVEMELNQGAGGKGDEYGGVEPGGGGVGQAAGYGGG